MASAKPTTRTSVKAAELSALVGSSAIKRRMLAAVLDPHLPDVVDALIQLSTGIYFEQEQTNSRGVVTNRVYQRAPNPKAISVFLRFANFDTGELANALLAATKVTDLQAQIAAKLPEMKAQNLASQTALNDENRIVFTASLVTQDDVLKAAMEVFSGLLSFIQMHPVEVMRDVVKSTETWQDWQMKAMREAQKAYARAVGIEEEDADLPPLPLIAGPVNLDEDGDDLGDDDETEEATEDDGQ